MTLIYSSPWKLYLEPFSNGTITYFQYLVLSSMGIGSICVPSDSTVVFICYSCRLLVTETRHANFHPYSRVTLQRALTHSFVFISVPAALKHSHTFTPSVYMYKKTDTSTVCSISVLFGLFYSEYILISFCLFPLSTFIFIYTLVLFVSLCCCVRTHRIIQSTLSLKTETEGKYILKNRLR